MPNDSATFTELVDFFLSQDGVEPMRRLVEHVRMGNVSDEDIAYLANGLAHSGKTLTLPNDTSLADIASTGGPSSLSTLLCPLYLRTMGFNVPKLGVPGRPAGGVDVMARIPGYRIVLSDDEVTSVLKSCGYVHFLASCEHTPKDGQLFSYRKTVDAVDIPELVIASLLSKKLAVGLTRAGLDVRVAPHGNFGSDWKTAKSNSERFIRVARSLGVDLVCFLSDATRPYQPFIGRGEALMAVSHVLEKSECSWLGGHAKVCFAMANSVVQGAVGWELAHSQLRSAFEENLKGQGSDYDAFESAVGQVQNAPRVPLTATKDGFVRIDLGTLRSALVNVQNSCKTDDDPFPDPAGIILKKNTGDYCATGDVLASIRCEDEVTEQFWSELNDAICVVSNPGQVGRFEEVRHA